MSLSINQSLSEDDENLIKLSNKFFKSQIHFNPFYVRFYSISIIGLFRSISIVELIATKSKIWDNMEKGCNLALNRVCLLIKNNLKQLY